MIGFYPIDVLNKLPLFEHLIKKRCSWMQESQKNLLWEANL